MDSRTLMYIQDVADCVKRLLLNAAESNEEITITITGTKSECSVKFDYKEKK